VFNNIESDVVILSGLAMQVSDHEICNTISVMMHYVLSLKICRYLFVEEVSSHFIELLGKFFHGFEYLKDRRILCMLTVTVTLANLNLIVLHYDHLHQFLALFLIKEIQLKVM